MDPLVVALAKAAGLDKALAAFPDDVAAAAAQALNHATAVQDANRSSRRTLAADAGGSWAMTLPHWLSAGEIGKAYREKALSPVELVTALLARIGVLDPKLNAFIRVDADAAMQAAKVAEAEILAGRLHGPAAWRAYRHQGYH